MFVANFRRQTITKVIKKRQQQQQQILNWAFFSRVFQGTLDFSFRTFLKFVLLTMNSSLRDHLFP